MFIDTKISQMNKSSFDIFMFAIVFVSRKPYETFLEEIDSKWIITRHYYIDSQIVF